MWSKNKNVDYDIEKCIECIYSQKQYLKCVRADQQNLPYAIPELF